MKKKVWLYLEPYTFIWNQSESAYIYNSLSGQGFNFFHSPETFDIAKNVLNLDNLYSVEIDEQLLNFPKVNEFITQIKNLTVGNLLPYKPIVFPPLLNLQSDIERLKKDESRSIGEMSLNYLHSLNIKVDLKNKAPKYWEKYTRFIRSIEKCNIVQLNLQGDNISNNNRSDVFLKELNNLNLRKTFLLSIDQTSESLLKWLTENLNNFNIKILVEVKFNKSQFFKYIESYKNIRNNLHWKFFVYSEFDYDKTNAVIEEYNLQNTEIKPIYTGNNLKFFEDNIYLTEEDLEKPGLNRREVFAHQALNTNDFGKLTIMPDSKVYANLHFPALGTIEDDIRELIYKELTNGQSWLRIRDMKPCCDCVYQWLCPSPSNYELAIGKPNLCHIKP